MQEALYQTIFRHIKTAVAVARPDGFLECNSAFLERFAIGSLAAGKAVLAPILERGLTPGQAEYPTGRGLTPLEITLLDDAGPLYLVEVPGREQDSWHELSMQAPHTRELLGRLTDAVVLVDDNGLILDINPAFEELFGYGRDEVLGAALDTLIVPPEQRGESARLFRKVLGQERVQVQVQRLTKTGQLLDLLATGYPMVIDRHVVGNYVIYKDVSYQHQAERRLREKEDFLTQLFNRSLSPMAILNKEECILEVNERFVGFFGYSREEALGRTIDELILPPEQHGESADFHRSVFNKNSMSARTLRRNKAGQLLPVEAVGSPIIQDGEVVGLFAMYRDISAEEAAMQAVRREKAYFQQLFDNTPTAVVLTDEHDLIRKVNHPFEVLFGFAEAEVLGRDLNELIVDPARKQEAVDYSRMVTDRGQCIEAEAVRRNRNGLAVEVGIIAFPILLDNDHLGAYVIYMDISERKRREREIEELLYRDSLTGLYNRAYAYLALDRRLRDGKAVLRVLYIDFDHFKEINDEYGHRAGDELLKAFARRMQERFAGLLEIYRIGGDEFLCVYGAEARVGAAEVEQAFSEPLECGNERLLLQLSVGEASAPADGGTVDQLISAADARMYTRKKIRRISAHPERRQASIDELLAGQA